MGGGACCTELQHAPASDARHGWIEGNAEDVVRVASFAQDAAAATPDLKGHASAAWQRTCM
jgi:hypothetical protein